MSKINDYVIQMEQEGAIYYDELSGRYQYTDREKPRNTSRSEITFD